MAHGDWEIWGELLYSNLLPFMDWLQRELLRFTAGQELRLEQPHSRAATV